MLEGHSRELNGNPGKTEMEIAHPANILGPL